MNISLLLLTFIILVALAVDYINGFHDAANSIATVVSTRVLTPMQAVVWAALFNVVDRLRDVDAEAKGGRGRLRGGGSLGDPGWAHRRHPLEPHHLVLRHPLQLVPRPHRRVLGAAVAKAGFGALLRPTRVDGLFPRLQLVSAAFYSLGHGTNDPQKTMGIIAILLFSWGHLGPEFYVPFWVDLAARAALGLGTLAGGWRIVKTMGMRLTKLRPVGGFGAETAGAIMLIGTAVGGIPVSTTHTITGSIIGVGATQRLSAVRWGLAGRIVWAWTLTIPLSALLAGLTWLLLPHG